MTVLDLGDPARWPEPARAVVQAIAEEVAEWPELHEFDDEAAEDALAGHLILASSSAMTW
ncbi:MAG: hypothetical protein ACRD1K_05775 [Acidimicrobiales bacterium]